MEPLDFEPRAPRKPPRKYSAVGKIVFYVSSLAPAALIAWKFDTVKEFLIGPAPPQPPPRVVAAAPVVPAKPDRPPRPKQAMAAPPRQFAKPRRQLTQPADIGDQTAKRREPKVERAPPPPKIVQSIDLNLSDRRQRIELADPKLTRLRILTLEGCEAPYEFHPNHAEFDGRSGVTIVISGRREVKLIVELRSPSKTRPTINVEALVTTAAGEDVAFTLPNIRRIQASIVKDGRQASEELDALASERERLQAWIEAPVAKPLATRGQARARLRQLDAAIPPLQATVQSLETELEAADAMEKLAMHLHDDCQIEISSGE